MQKNILISAILLGLFAVLGTGLVAFTYDKTAPRIAENERELLLHRLHELVPAEAHDNVLDSDTINVNVASLGSKQPLTIYRARKQGKPVAAIMTVVASEGYSGDIRLLVAIRADGELAGVRVIKHNETPGLGDAIEETRSSWILGFAGKSLQNLSEKEWHVKRDGGSFDQFSGATITPRAVVKAVHNALLYFTAHRDELFRQTQEAKHE